MKYPEEFKKRVLKLYPDYKNLNEALERGSQIVGRYLDDMSSSSIHYGRIIEAFEDEREHEIYDAAIKCREQRLLYVEWWDLKNGNSFKKELKGEFVK